MKKVFTIIMVCISITSLSACKEEKSEDWYKKHPQESFQKYSQCLSSGESTLECEYSHRAALMFAHEGRTEFKELFRQKEEMRRNALK